jgi:hypothetical protein
MKKEWREREGKREDVDGQLSPLCPSDAHAQPVFSFADFHPEVCSNCTCSSSPSSGSIGPSAFTLCTHLDWRIVRISWGFLVSSLIDLSDKSATTKKWKK